MCEGVIGEISISSMEDCIEYMGGSLLLNVILIARPSVEKG
jgi:hypothetical protein